jgi:hypothetical protein
MNAYEISLAIEQYLRNCGQNPKEWDVEAAADEIAESGEIDSIDDVDPDEFSKVLEKHQITEE